jgi:hypothetical protein
VESQTILSKLQHIGIDYGKARWGAPTPRPSVVPSLQGYVTLASFRFCNAGGGRAQPLPAFAYAAAPAGDALQIRDQALADDNADPMQSMRPVRSSAHVIRALIVCVRHLQVPHLSIPHARRFEDMVQPVRMSSTGVV